MSTWAEAMKRFKKIKAQVKKAKIEKSDVKIEELAPLRVYNSVKKKDVITEQYKLTWSFDHDC